MDLVLWLDGMWIAGEKRHPQQIIRDLGITYNKCSANPIPQNWIFYGVENVPDELPEYIHLSKSATLPLWLEDK